MAKGSGGVGKKSGSVSGSVAKPAAPAAPMAPRPVTVENLRAAAQTLTDGDKWRGRVFLGPLLKAMGTTPQAAEKQLLALHQAGKITLSRADLVEAMGPAMVKASEISHPTGARFHFLSFDVD